MKITGKGVRRGCPILPMARSHILKQLRVCHQRDIAMNGHCAAKPPKNPVWASYATIPSIPYCSYSLIQHLLLLMYSFSAGFLFSPFCGLNFPLCPLLSQPLINSCGGVPMELSLALPNLLLPCHRNIILAVACVIIFGVSSAYCHKLLWCIRGTLEWFFCGSLWQRKRVLIEREMGSLFGEI